MCGIAGAIGRFSTMEGQDLVRSMTSSLSHRGPDAQGTKGWSFGDNSVIFGHTRLSIIDLSDAGRQPMTERSGRYWTAYNGEIYNYRELRKLLDPQQELFQTGTDTEVILHAYHRWGKLGFRN